MFAVNDFKKIAEIQPEITYYPDSIAEDESARDGRNTLIGKLKRDYGLKFVDDSRYAGDGYQNLRGTENYSVGDCMHELGHTIFFAGKDPKRLAYSQWGMKLKRTLVHDHSVVEIKSTIPVDNEIAASAIAARLLSWFGYTQEEINTNTLCFLDLLVNDFKIAGYENIPTPMARKIRNRKEYGRVKARMKQQAKDLTAFLMQKAKVRKELFGPNFEDSESDMSSDERNAAIYQRLAELGIHHPDPDKSKGRELLEFEKTHYESIRKTECAERLHWAMVKFNELYNLYTDEVCDGLLVIASNEQKLIKENLSAKEKTA